MSTTESLHKQCRTLESLFDNKLTAYSRLAATITRPGSHDLESTGSLERWQDLEVELEELLQKVRIVSDYVVWFLTFPDGCSWERSTTSLILCQTTRAVKQRRRCYAPFRDTETCIKITLESSVGPRYVGSRRVNGQGDQPPDRQASNKLWIK